MKAQETAKQIDLELKELQATLANIEDARPFEDLTVSLELCHWPLNFTHNLWEQVDDVGRAHPQIAQAVETMVKKGKWSVPGSFSSHFPAVTSTQIYLARRIQREVRQHGSHVDRPRFFFMTGNIPI